MKFKIPLTSICACALLISSPAVSQETDPSELMRVVSHELVSKKRVSRTEFDYEYKVTVENNTNTDYSGLFVIVDFDSPTVQILDEEAKIGSIHAFSEKKSEDSIVVRVDRRQAFNPAELLHFFDNDTLEGVDVDEDGVRDDVELFLTENFELDETALSLAMALAANLQNKIIKWSDADEISESDQFRGMLILDCLSKNTDAYSAISRAINIVTLNTPAREEKYRNFLDRQPDSYSSVPDLANNPFCPND